MGHGKELLTKISSLLERDYPKAKHQYAYEVRLNGSVPKLYPDILIWRQDENITNKLPMAVIEIGYTRPEKLMAYKDKYKIPDIRWYSKAGELINPQKIESKIIKTKLANVNKFYNIKIKGYCYDCFKEEWNHWTTDDCGQKLLFFDEDEAVSEGDGMATLDCQVDVWSDGEFIYAVQFCDVCGGWRILNDYDLSMLTGWSDMDSFRAFQKEYYKQRSKFELMRQSYNSEHPKEQIEQYHQPRTYDELEKGYEETTPISIDYDKFLNWNHFSHPLKANA